MWSFETGFFHNHLSPSFLKKSFSLVHIKSYNGSLPWGLQGTNRETIGEWIAPEEESLASKTENLNKNDWRGNMVFHAGGKLMARFLFPPSQLSTYLS